MVSNLFSVVVSGNVRAAIQRRADLRMGVPHKLYRSPIPGKDNHSARRLNYLLRQCPNLISYLEIGLYAGKTFEQVRATRRVGVDPQPRFDVTSLPQNSDVFVMTSDEYFDSRQASETGFDLVYLDGLHTFRQTYRDLIHSFRIGGAKVVLIDDVVPVDEVAAIPDQTESYERRQGTSLARSDWPWQGDVFKVICAISEVNREIAFCTITDGENAQALAWLNQPDLTPAMADPRDLLSFDEMCFTDVFGDGIPGCFNPMSETQGLARAIERVLR